MAASTDRISELPQPLLHHILCFLTQEEAVQTCVLSKSWRYLGSTRPKFEFLQKKIFRKQTNLFLSILGKTLHMYRDQNLCAQEFRVELPSGANTETVVFLEKWFPFIVATMGGVKTFDLSSYWPYSGYFDLPSEVFENSKSLRNLRLRGFRFWQNLPMDYKVQHLKHLRTLTLEDVHIVDETFQNIMSCCPYIEHVFLNCCKGLKTIRLMNCNYLKRFDLFDSEEPRLKEDLCLVDVPNLESVKISWCRTWFKFDRHSKMYFPALKSLHLVGLGLQIASLDILSHDFPCLQHFYIEYCKGFGELRVLNRSIKHLAISRLGKSIKVVVDAPNMEVLDYGSSIPMEISFATTSNECKSNIMPGTKDVLIFEDDFQGLSKLLKAVSQSEITLELPYDDDLCFDNDYHDIYGGYDKPALVDYVRLCFAYHRYFYSEGFLNRMFRYCRPRNILEEECTQRSDFLCKILLLRQKNEIPCYWQRDLEEASMQVRDQNTEEWHSVEGTTFLEFDYSNNYKGPRKDKIGVRALTTDKFQ